jgi:DNA-binding FadR family transcriptional regulator
MANFEPVDFDPFEGDALTGGPFSSAKTKITVRPQSPYAGAIGKVESGHNYRALGPVTRDGDRAYGFAQVMGKNVGPWTQEILGRRMTPQEFLDSDDAQNAVFNAKFGGYVKKYGPEGAARAWFAGEGGMNDPNRKDILGTSVADYARKFNGAMGSQPPQAGSFAPQQQPQQQPQVSPQAVAQRAPPAAAPQFVPVDHDPFAEPPGPSAGDYATDIAKSAGVGVGKGVIGLGGAVGDLSNLGAAGLAKASEYLQKTLGLPKDHFLFANPLPDEAKAALRSILDYVPTSQNITKQVEGVTGEFYKPQTRPGEYAQTVGEFLPGAMLGPGGMARNAMTFGVVPGLASEAAGGMVKGTAAEPWVRGGTALATGAIGGLATAPGNVANTVNRAAQGVTRQQVEAAERLFQEAQAMGVPITRAEAIQAVTGGASSFGNLQRVVEGQGGMRDTFAARPAQVDAGAGQAFDAITPAAPNPSTIGPAVGTAAEGTINDVRGIINQASEPYYAAAAAQRIPAAEMGRLRMAPGWREARDAVRNDPQLARYVQGLPDNSVGFVNEVKKYLDTAAENAASPVNQQRNMQRSAGYGQDAELVRTTAESISPEYATALAIQRQAREQYLQPLLDGPLGKLASRDITTQKAIEALFPTKPVANSAHEIETAVRALSQRNPNAARQLVRAHAESVFNETTQRLQTGANEFGGAKFAAVLRGNPQQAANLEAAVRALPNGDQIWGGLDRFLTILEAQGTRQRIGSQTAFNQEALQDLRQGNLISEAGATVASGGFKLPSKMKDRIERWRLGQNVDELARLFTEPNAGREFGRLANAPSSGAQATASFLRIVGLARQAAADREPTKVTVNPSAYKP